MIYISEFKTPVTPEQGLELLRTETAKLGCFIDLDCVLAHESYYIIKSEKLVREWRKEGGDDLDSLLPSKRNALISVLINRFGIPEYKLKSRHTAGLSVSDPVLSALLSDASLSEQTRNFIKLTQELKECITLKQGLQQFKSLPLSRFESFDGHRMVLAQPCWGLLNTNRYSSSNPNIQGVSHKYADIFTAPKGYRLVSADSGQIEPRITYSWLIRDPLIKDLITGYNDAYYGLLHFIQLSDKETEAIRNGGDIALFNITDEVKNKRQNLKKAALASNYGSCDLSSIDPVLGPLYIKKILNHPERLRLSAFVRNQVASGNETFYTAFGNPITPKATQRYNKDSAGWTCHAERCGINNPIQGTAADLMLFSLHNAVPVLHECGGFLAYYRHDEGCFYVPEDKADVYAVKLAGCLSYQVDVPGNGAWLPVYSDMHIGRKQVDNNNGVL